MLKILINNPTNIPLLHLQLDSLNHFVPNIDYKNVIVMTPNPLTPILTKCINRFLGVQYFNTAQSYDRSIQSVLKTTDHVLFLNSNQIFISMFDTEEIPGIFENKQILAYNLLLSNGLSTDFHKYPFSNTYTYRNYKYPFDVMSVNGMVFQASLFGYMKFFESSLGKITTYDKFNADFFKVAKEYANTIPMIYKKDPSKVIGINLIGGDVNEMNEQYLNNMIIDPERFRYLTHNDIVLNTEFSMRHYN